MINLFKNDKHVKKIYRFISLTPYLISKDEYFEIKKATESIGKILEKTIVLFQKNIEVRKFFGFNEKYNEIAANYYFDENLFLSRFDGYIDKTKKIKFLEFNTDYPGSIIRLDTVQEKIYDSLSMTECDKNNYFLSSFIELAKINYSKHKKVNDVFAIGYGSWQTEEKIYTLNFLKKCLRDENIPAEVVQWKDLVIKNDYLYYDNRIVSVLFRAELSDRIVNRDYRDYQNILNSVLKKNIFIYNPTSTMIAGSKNVMALWFTDFFQKLITTGEKDIINRYIPKTYFVNQSNYENILSKRDVFVLKPILGHGGEGIIIGKNETKEKWSNAVKIALKNRDYIAQEYIEPITEKIDILDLQNQVVNKYVKVKININPWYVNKKIVGISGRFAQDDIVNIKQGGGSLPVYYKNN